MQALLLWAIVTLLFSTATACLWAQKEYSSRKEMTVKFLAYMLCGLVAVWAALSFIRQWLLL